MDNKELKNEEVVNETVEETKVIEPVDEETHKEEKEKKEGKATKFLKKILVGVIDQIISIAVSLLLIIVVDLILKLFGLYIAQREPMFLIIYVIVNIIYGPICASTKLKDTIGKKIMLK